MAKRQGLTYQTIAPFACKFYSIIVRACVIVFPSLHLIRHTDFKHLKVSLQFPEGYPGAPLLVEVASKSVQERLLEGLVRVCDDELRKLTGKRQVCVCKRWYT